MTYNVFSGTLNPTESINQSLLAGWQEGHLARKNLCHLSPKFLFWQQMESDNWWELANPGSIGMENIC